MKWSRDSHDGGASDAQGPPDLGERGTIARLTVVLAIAVLATSLYANLPHALGLACLYGCVPPFDGRDINMVSHLGGEHRSVAEALCAGRGFADPFQEPSGPTAWVAPLLPTIQALLLALGGANPATIAIVALQDLTLIFTGWLVIRAASRSRWRRMPVVGLALFYASTWSYFSSCYQFTHDSWLIMLWVGALVYAAEKLRSSSLGRRAMAGWGLLGGLAMVSSPVLGPVWVALGAPMALASRRARPLLLSGAVAVSVLAPWIARNAIVFGRFIPVKSNLAFEFHQSNVLEPDGLLREETGWAHPYRPSGHRERSRYRELGEMAYLDEQRVKSLEAVREDPAGYVARARNRLLAATLIYHPFNSHEGRRQVLLRSLIFPLPFVGLALVLVTRGWTRDRSKVAALTVYVCYLTPYVLVAYYRRYAIPLLGLQVMFEIWGLDAVLGLRLRRAEAGGVAAESRATGPAPPGRGPGSI